METNEQDKEAFFALYWGQRVIYAGDYNMQVAAGDVNEISLKNSKAFILILHSLTEITNNDVLDVATMNGGNTVTFGYRCLTSFGITHFKCGQSIEFKIAPKVQTIDFLRSRGYLLPFRQYTVEQLIELGWAKTTKQG